jgi:hypothetical protein
MIFKISGGRYYTRCPRTRAPEKKGEILIKRQIKILKEKNLCHPGVVLNGTW